MGKGGGMSFNVREKILAYWNMFKFFAMLFGFISFMYLLAKFIKGV